VVVEANKNQETLQDYEIDMISGTSAVLKSIPSADWSIKISPYLASPVGVVVDRLLQEWTTLSSQQRSHIEETAAKVSEDYHQVQQLTVEDNDNNRDEEWPETSESFQEFTTDTSDDAPFEDRGFGREFRQQGKTNRSSKHAEWLDMEDDMMKILERMRNQYVSTKGGADEVNL
jgi:hypothetical protein